MANNVKVLTQDGFSMWKQTMENKNFNENLILGQDVYLTNDSPHANTLVVGACGTGKNFAYALPNLLQMNSSFVVIDSYCENYNILKPLLEKNGYKVKILNTKDANISNKYNPLKYALNMDNTKKLFCRLTSAYYKEDYWQECATYLYEACFYYLKEKSNQQNITLNDLLVLLNSFLQTSNFYKKENNESNVINKITKIFESLSEDSAARQAYSVFSKASQSTCVQIIFDSIVWLEGLLSSQIQNITQDDDLELDKLGDEKTALFICPGMNKNTTLLSNVLCEQIYEQLMFNGDFRSNKGLSKKSKYRVHFILDEFANTGEIINLVKYLKYASEYNIATSILIQSIEQLQYLQNTPCKELLLNCDTVLFLGSCEEETLAWASQLLGNQQIGKQSKPIYSVRELAKLHNDNCIVYHRGQIAFMTQKYRASSHPEFKNLSK